MLYSSDLLKSRINKHKIEQQPRVERNYLSEALELSTSDDTKVILHNEKDSSFYRDYIMYLVADINNIIAPDKCTAQISILKNLVTTSNRFKIIYRHYDQLLKFAQALPADFSLDVNYFNPNVLFIPEVNQNAVDAILSINKHVDKIRDIISMVNNSYSGQKLYNDLIEYNDSAAVYTSNYNVDSPDNVGNINKNEILTCLDNFNDLIINDGILKMVSNKYQYLGIKMKDLSRVIDMISDLEDKGYDAVVVNKYTSMLERHINGIYDRFKAIGNFIIEDNEKRVIFCYTLFDVLYDVYNSMNGDVIVLSDRNDDIETELEAVLFLANMELNEDAAYIDYIRESTGLIALQEAEGVNLMKYIGKISQGITKVFDKFSKGIDKAIDGVKKKINDGLDKLEGKIAKLDNPGFIIENYPNFNFDRLNMIKVREFNYEQMKPNLATIEKYMKFYYPQVYTYKEGESASKAFKEYFMNGTTNLKVTQETLLQMTAFIRDDFGKYRENIKADIATINKANEAIANLSKSTSDTTGGETDQATPKADTSTSTPGATPMTDVNANTVTNNSAEISGGIAITEADEKKSTKFVDDADRKSPEGANNSTLKNVQVYMSVSTSLISAKLSTVSKRLTLSVRTIIHAFTAPKKNKEPEEQK